MPTKKNRNRSLPALQCRGIDQADIVDEIGRGIIATNHTMCEIALRFAHFNCVQKTRCSPAVYREACARFGITSVAARTYLLDRFDKRVQDNARTCHRRGLVFGVQDPAFFSRKPWLDEWQACFNVCSYIFRCAATAGWHRINPPILELMRRAAELPRDDVLRRDAAFLSLTRDLLHGTVLGSFSRPAQWIVDIILSAVTTEVGVPPVKQYDRWQKDTDEFANLLIRSAPLTVPKVTDFCDRNPHYNLDCLLCINQNVGSEERPKRDTRYVRPVTLAIILGNIPLLGLFVRKGVDLNARSISTPAGKHFETPLHASLDPSLHTFAACRMLLTCPEVDVTAARADGNTALHLIVKLLVKRSPGLQGYTFSSQTEGDEGSTQLDHFIADVACAITHIKAKCTEPGSWDRLRRMRNNKNETACDLITDWWMRGPCGAFDYINSRRFGDRVSSLANLLFHG